ncbi:Trp biosynthesis-associated membrane protein [Microterricola viridarii]|uniref:Tryptophan-associated transmembrane protein (Trp_oprn_chp) n=1 Tax=Microterricola viridarii TaxID=412690 RepID=A0A0X8E3H6_9MICO|nr:Trp biosynthesis-associated membrane protein [Microterricola viridarii]AMB58371.1 hypothetical protein AWU67_05340 [Microterricola viridarii]
MSASRFKMLLVVGGLLSAVLALIAWTQTWVVAHVEGLTVSVDGAAAAPALSALALAGLALGGALAIAGPVFRIVLGLLEVLLGVAVVIASSAAIINPAAAAISNVTTLTGIAGDTAVLALISDAGITAWPWLGVLAGVLFAAAGVGVLVTSRRWPGPGRKYQAVRLEHADGAPLSAKDAAIDNWDELSRGSDPTEQ